MVLCQSQNATVRLVGVRSFNNGTAPRINNPGMGDISDLAQVNV
jgi:hypothetical protein